MRSIGSREVFELQAAKRGGRLGWHDSDGTKAFVRWLAHSKEPGVICWRETDPNQIELGGRPKTYDPEELYALLPPEGLETKEWVRQARSECGLSEATLHRERRLLAKPVAFTNRR